MVSCSALTPWRLWPVLFRITSYNVCYTKLLRNKKFIIAGILVICLITVGVAVAKIYFSAPKVTYITAPVTRMDLEESVLATGILNAYKTVAVGAQVNGQLKTLHVDFRITSYNVCYTKLLRKIAGFTAYLFNFRQGVKLYIDVPADLDQFR